MRRPMHARDQQPIHQWIAARCLIGDGAENPTRLHEDYIEWVRALPVPEQPSPSAGRSCVKFVQLVVSLGYHRGRVRGLRVILGLALRERTGDTPVRPNFQTDRI